MQPLIGITTSTLDRAPEGAIQPSSAVHLAYSRCLLQAGAMPILLPNILQEGDVDEVLTALDGVLFSGGGDIDASFLHEPPHPATTFIDQQRDRFELALLRGALNRDLPVFGICRGAQVMAIACGGALWQDIPSQCPAALPHRQLNIARNQPSHDVTVVSESILAQILWPDFSSENHLLSVNSFHHQAIRDCGTLMPVAMSSDGLVEALALPHARFFLGVQWHPEDLVDTDCLHARIFSAFTAAARKS